VESCIHHPLLLLPPPLPPPLLLQMPTSVRSMWRDPDGVTEVDDDMDVTSTLDLLQACREGLRSLQHQELLVYTAGADLAYSYHAVAQQLLAALGPGALAAGGLGLLRLAQQPAGVRFLGGPQSSPGGLGGGGGGGSAGMFVGADGSERLQEKSLAAATAALSAQLAAAAAARARLEAQGEGSGYFGPSDALWAPPGGSSGLLPPGMTLPVWARGVLDVNQLADLLRPGRLSQTHAVLQQWVSQQAQGALESLEANRRGVLALLREEALSTRVGQRHSMSLALRVDLVNWALANGPQTFVQGELQVRRRTRWLHEPHMNCKPSFVRLCVNSPAMACPPPPPHTHTTPLLLRASCTRRYAECNQLVRCHLAFHGLNPPPPPHPLLTFLSPPHTKPPPPCCPGHPV
jgi:hypothetical protein